MTKKEELSGDQRNAILETNRSQMRKIVDAARPGAVSADRQFVFFAAFDGTNNDLTNKGNPQTTNVVQLYRQAEAGQRSHPNLSANYYPGPGTPGTLDRSSWVNRAVTKQVRDAADNAYADFAAQASTWLADNPGGRVTTVLASFSRGGASAAIFSQKLFERGLIDPNAGNKVLIAPGEVKVSAGVLFDPVMTGVECDLAFPPNVTNVVDIRAQDEYRQLFKAADYSSQAGVTTIDMLGNHCDIGGSYDNGIAALALQAATEFLQRSGVPIADAEAARRFGGVDTIGIHSEEVDDFNRPKWDVYAQFAALTIKNPSPRLAEPVVGRSTLAGRRA